MFLIKNSKLYDRLKWIAQVFLPGFAALYFSLSDIWNLPKANEVVGTITVLDTFLGTLLQLSSSAYQKSDERFDGSIDVTDSGDKKTFSLGLQSDPNELDKKDSVTFKVNKDVPMVEDVPLPENPQDPVAVETSVPAKKAPKKRGTRVAPK